MSGKDEWPADRGPVPPAAADAEPVPPVRMPADGTSASPVTRRYLRALLALPPDAVARVRSVEPADGLGPSAMHGPSMDLGG